MKSIFKKIAFVLALAMVVTMMPAKAAAAASNDGPQMYTTLKLYIGGDVTGQIAEQRYAKVWNKGDYEVSFESEDPSIAKVNSKGYVTAVGVGSTTITATFTAEGEDDVVKTCAVTVKKNAAKVGLGSESAKTVAEGIPAGEVVQLTALRKDEEGHTEWNKSMKNYSTDSVRFSSSNPEVFTVTKTTGKLTAVKEGEATLKVWTVQSEGFDEEAQEYPEVVSKEYTVKVYNAGILSVKQVSTDSVAITCGNADVAAAIAKDFSKLNVEYMLGENPIKIDVKSAEVDSTNNKVVNVTLYSAMNKDVVYKFTYEGKTVQLTAVDPNAIASIRIVTTQAKIQTETEIVVQFLDVNGVIINPGTNALTFTKEDDSSDYSLYSDGNKGFIYFLEANKTARIKATYDMGWDEKGNKIEAKTATATIVSKVASDADNMVGYAAAAQGKKASELGYTTGTLSIVKNEATQLYAKYTVKNFDGTTSTFYNVSSDAGQVENGNFFFKYVSTNDAVVLVDEMTGVMTPVASNGGSAQIIIYRVIGDKEVVVGAVTVRVESMRVFTTYDVSMNKTKLSDNGMTGETARITVEAKDQLGQHFADSSSLEYSAKIMGNVAGVNVTVGGSLLNANSYLPVDFVRNEDGSVKIDNGKVFFDVKVDINADITSSRNIQISLRAEQPDSKVSKAINRSLQVKRPGNVSTYSLDLSQGTINVNLPQATSWWSGLDSEISLNAYDSQGFFIRKEAMSNTATPAAGAFGFTVTKGNTNIPVDGTTFKALSSEQVTVSGSSVTGSAVDFVKKIPNTDLDSVGTYIIKVFQGQTNGQKQIAVKSIIVTDTTVTSVASVTDNKVGGTDETTVLYNLQNKLASGSLVIKRGNDKLNDNLVITGVKIRGSQSDRVFVESIHVVETLKGGRYDGKTFGYDITIGQVFYTN